MRCPTCGKRGYCGYIREIPITVLDDYGAPKWLTHRLVDSYIFTVEELKDKTDQEILKRRNFGPHALSLIRKSLEKMNRAYGLC